jgi:lysozyme
LHHRKGNSLVDICIFACVTPPRKPVISKATKPAYSRKPAIKKKPVSRKTTTHSKPLRWIIPVIGLLILLSPLYYKYVLKMFANAWHIIVDIGEDPNYRHYKNFNVYVAEKYTVHGIDVSYAQGKIDWGKVKLMDDDGLHVSFAIIKATEGKNLTDTYFHRNWREAAKVGLTCGAYHYFRPGINGSDQARFFLDKVHLEKGDMPMVVDVETLDGVTPEQLRSQLNQFIYIVHHITGVKPIIYSGLSFYQDYLEGFYNNYTLWIAHYEKPELKLKPQSNWMFWQHSDKARVNGINHTVDFDTFKGDSTAFNELLIH